MDDFDAAAEVARLKREARERRQHPYRLSRLERHARELLALADAGASAADLARWLRERRVRVPPRRFSAGSGATAPSDDSWRSSAP